MGKYFEVRYAPDSWNTPPGGVATAWSSPYGGLHVQAPASQIPPQYSPALNNVILRNNAITSRPKFQQLTTVPEANNPSQIYSFLSADGNNHVVSFGIGGLYDGGGPWTNKGGSRSVLGIQVAAQAFKRIFYWTSPAAPFTALAHTSAWDGLVATAVTDVAFSGATNPPGAGQASYAGTYVGTLANRIILLNTIETDISPRVARSFPYRIRWSNNGFDPYGAGAFGSNLGTAGATFDPSINSGAGFNDLLDVQDSITGAAFLGRVGYVFRTNGVTEMTPTGNGQAPYDFNHLWANSTGIGSVYGYTVSQYGAMAAFTAIDNVYVIDPSGLRPIGGGARDAIIRDITTSTAFGKLTAVLSPALYADSTGTNYVPYLVYAMFIPISVSNTRVYIYSFEDNNWTSFTLTGTVINDVPSVINKVGNSWSLAMPTSTSGSVFIGSFSNDFNDTVDGSSYTFRAENIAADRVPTIRRIVIEYVDLGAATVSVTVTGTNDNGAAVTATAANVVIGNVNAGAIVTKFIDLQFTGFRPQVTISRAANGGQLRISAVTLIGEVEEQQL